MSTSTIATAHREGTAGPIADATATYTSAATGHTAVALVDGMGHDPAIVRLAPMLAESAARAGAQVGVLGGLLHAGVLARDPGPDAVGVLAVLRKDGTAQVAWAGDCRAYHWDGTSLAQLTTDHNLAAYLTKSARGAGEVPVSALADYVGVTLGLALPAATPFVAAPAGGLLILTSDGVHDQAPDSVLESLVREHEGTPQALADALVAAAEPTAAGYRDDATAVVVHRGAGAGRERLLSPESAMRLGELSSMARRELESPARERVLDAIYQVMHSPTADHSFALMTALRGTGLSW
ncbi:hypothetical protein [Kitasatospora purpeofusca]|uniref:hypothetical protein n=1 Tax=Kitasatospora purpeofusca TaxID=67352 RepID=UPI0038162D91